MSEQPASFSRLLELARAAEEGGGAQEAYRLARVAMQMPGYERSHDALALLHKLARAGWRTGIRDLWERSGIAVRAMQDIAIAARQPIGALAGARNDLHIYNLTGM